jgi:peptide/nickel transport system permease protein
MLVRRVLVSLPVLFIVSVLSFVLINLIPGDPARTLLGPLASAEQVARLRVEMGLDQPVWIQYWDWLSDALRGNLGSSLFTSEPVTSILGSRLEVSISLVVLGTVASSLVGVTIGLISAVRGGWISRLVDTLSLAGMAIPNFWLGLALIFVFAVAIRLFPASGYTPLQVSAAGWAQSLVLPVVALAVGGTTIIAAQTRDSVLDTLGRDFVRVLKANGLSARSVLFKHVLRAAAIPIVTVIGIVFVSLLSGTVFVETLFSLPGLGSAAVQATLQHDFPVVQGAVLDFTLMVIVVNLGLDVLYAWLNPKVRVR